MKEKSMNERLAVEVMDMCQPPEPDGYWWKDVGNDCLERFSPVKLWKPDKNLNQLRMCYEAAEKDAEDAEKFESMVYWHVSEDLRLINKCFNKDITTAIFKHPELVAQAILKAKGVI